MPISPKADCPCGSGKTYKACCQVFHKGTQPTHPEQLMRARYSAYAAGNVAFIMQTTHPQSPHRQADAKAWRASLREFCEGTQFLGLRVLASSVDDDDAVGYVRFQAILMQDGRDASFVEHSRFQRVDGRWLYVAAE